MILNFIIFNITLNEMFGPKKNNSVYKLEVGIIYLGYKLEVGIIYLGCGWTSSVEGDEGSYRHN